MCSESNVLCVTENVNICLWLIHQWGYFIRTWSLFYALCVKSVQDNVMIYVLQYGNFEDWQLLLWFFTAVGKDEAVRGDFVGKFTTPAELSEHICVVTPESKPLVLYHMITSNSWQHVLVFVGSRKDAHRLSLLLSNLGQMSFRVAEISSSLSRLARERVLAKFSAGKIDVWVVLQSTVINTLVKHTLK